MIVEKHLFIRRETSVTSKIASLITGRLHCIMLTHPPETSHNEVLQYNISSFLRLLPLPGFNQLGEKKKG